jgi:hypothetical protein
VGHIRPACQLPIQQGCERSPYLATIDDDRHREERMESQPSEPFGPELVEAQQTLTSALAEACSAELTKANTGELIRVEEVLAIAGEAAKKAVSIRRRMRRDRGSDAARKSRQRAAETEDTNVATPAHRVFLDAAGVQWDAFAVHPSSEVSNRARLPDPYQSGWLSFDSGQERRRLSPVPEDWRTMSEDGLRELCARAEAVPRRVTPSTDRPPTTPPEPRPNDG